MLAGNITIEKPALVAEIVGPAGAGKTTVSQALGRYSDTVRVGFRLRRARYIPLFARKVLWVLPTVIGQSLEGRRLARQEIILMIHLKVLHRVLQQQISNDSKVTILDQGPVFKLAWLYGFGSASFKDQSFEKWWDNMFAQWNSSLDFIIRLEASDDVLAERIRVRSKWHSVKGKSEQEIREFLSRYRTSYNQVLARLTSDNGPTLLCFDTEHESPDQIVEKLVTVFTVH